MTVLAEAAVDRPIKAAARSAAVAPLVDVLSRLSNWLTADDRVAALLHGRWLGHPAHAMVVQAPIGLLMSAAVVDRVPGGDRAARSLLGLALASAAPAAATGLADGGQANPEHQRVAALHGALNVVGLGLAGASYLRRRTGSGGKGLTLGSLAVLSVSGMIGGHLSFRMASGANRTAGVRDRLPEEWTDLGALSELPEGRPVRRLAGPVALAVVRHGAEVAVLADECPHLSGPLSEGTVDADGCLVCPWHGSRFDLLDGSVRGGPAVAPAPVLDVRVSDGRVLVRAAG